MKDRRNLVWISTLAPIVVPLIIVAAWALDTGAAGGQVLRNVELNGAGIGGLPADRLRERIASTATDLEDREVRIETPSVTYETTAADIGLDIDVAATADAALDEGRTALLPVRPLGWLLSFVRPHQAAIHFTVDVETARSELRRLEGASLVSPVEPTIRSVDGDEFEAVPGEAGTGIDPAMLAEVLTDAAESTPVDEPLEISVEQTDLSPRLDDSVAEDAAIDANEATADPLRVTALGETAEIVPRELRRLAAVVEVEDGLELTLDPAAVLEVLRTDFADLRVEPVSATFEVDGSTPRLVPAVTGLECCDEEAATTVVEAFEAGEDAVEIELAATDPDLTTEAAEALGIVEEVGQPTVFGPTTRHACCQPRVTNIHRISDLVRGAIIPPGAVFSLNDYVGRRTPENGFVEAGVVYDGLPDTDYGGGISQFTTSLFNAALYAGLDFPEYQSHSLHFDRYPKGHEATISFPKPDLKIENTTPYGILIWPRYTDTSITVHLYSTRFVDVSLGEPTSSPAGNCTRWTTPVTRTYLDGSTERDSVSATYRPGEGINC